MNVSHRAVAAVLLASLWCVPARPAQPAAQSRVGQSPSHAGQADVLSLPPSDGPLKVRASFHLVDINEISDEEETFEFSGVLTVTWQDPRQAFDTAEAGTTEKLYQGAYQFDELAPAWYPQVALVNVSGLYESEAVLLRVQPDGTSTMILMINAIAEADLNLRRYPFDRQRLEAALSVFGFDSNEVLLEAGSVSVRQAGGGISIPQWNLRNVEVSTPEFTALYLGDSKISSAFVLTVEVQREPFFMLRLIALPLSLIVFLSFSVFWMDRSSLGDRMSVSFVGILTAVTYQILIGDIFPDIAYFTLMNGFLTLSFLVMCATVVANLAVGSLEKGGNSEGGDRLERRCRRIFPLAYFGLVAVVVAVAFIAF